MRVTRFATAGLLLILLAAPATALRTAETCWYVDQSLTSTCEWVDRTVLEPVYNETGGHADEAYCDLTGRYPPNDRPCGRVGAIPLVRDEVCGLRGRQATALLDFCLFPVFPILP